MNLDLMNFLEKIKGFQFRVDEANDRILFSGINHDIHFFFETHSEKFKKLGYYAFRIEEEDLCHGNPIPYVAEVFGTWTTSIHFYERSRFKIWQAPQILLKDGEFTLIFERILKELAGVSCFEITHLDRSFISLGSFHAEDFEAALEMLCSFQEEYFGEIFDKDHTRFNLSEGGTIAIGDLL